MDDKQKTQSFNNETEESIHKTSRSLLISIDDYAENYYNDQRNKFAQEVISTLNKLILQTSQYYATTGKTSILEVDLED